MIRFCAFGALVSFSGASLRDDGECCSCDLSSTKTVDVGNGGGFGLSFLLGGVGMESVELNHHHNL